MLFELVTPDRLLISREVKHVVARSEEGSFGVLEGHQPLLASSLPSAIKIEHEDGEDFFFVGYGFIDVTGDKVTVLAEEACPLTELNKETLEARLAEVLAEITKTDDIITTATLNKEKMLLEAKLEAIAL